MRACKWFISDVVLFKRLACWLPFKACGKAEKRLVYNSREDLKAAFLHVVQEGERKHGCEGVAAISLVPDAPDTRHDISLLAQTCVSEGSSEVG